jgi:hypothetical protein
MAVNHFRKSFETKLVPMTFVDARFSAATEGIVANDAKVSQ